MKMKRNRWRMWIAIGIVLVILLALIYLVDWEEFIFIFSLTDWRLVLAGSLTLILGYILIPIRFRRILVNKPGFLNTFYSDSVGYMVTLFSPIPSQALRVVTLNRVTDLPFHFVSSGMVVETLLGVVMRILAFIGALLLATKFSESIWSIILGAAVIVLTFIGIVWMVNHIEIVVKKINGWVIRFPISTPERLEQIMSEIQIGVKEVGSKQTLTTGMVYSISMWLLFVIFFSLAWLALPVELFPREILALSVASLVFVPPSAPAMIGVYQGILIGSLSLLRIADVTSLTAYSILVFTIQLTFWLVMGVWSIFRMDLKLNELIDRARIILDKSSQNDTSVS